MTTADNPLDEAEVKVSSRIVVIDDCRVFNTKSRSQLNDETDLYYARTSGEGLEVLAMCRDRDLYIHQLWLDHDLGWDDTIMPVVDELCRAAHEGARYPIQKIIVHTSNPSAVDSMMRSLIRYQYHTTRVLAENFFTI